jgi:hypothetical protein
MATAQCATCYGSGEWVSDQGPTVCPDCFGDGTAPASGNKMEWRLREIERRTVGSGPEIAADVRWLVHEVRRTRDALVHIMARCQDADEGDRLAEDVKFRANDALGLYSEE